MGCAKRVHATLGFGFLESAYALLVNFGRSALQYDTFDLDKLPSATSLDAPASCGEAAATNIILQVESGSMARSAGEAGMCRRKRSFRREARRAARSPFNNLGV